MHKIFRVVIDTNHIISAILSALEKIEVEQELKHITVQKTDGEFQENPRTFSFATLFIFNLTPDPLSPFFPLFLSSPLPLFLFLLHHSSFIILILPSMTGGAQKDNTKPIAVPVVQGIIVAARRTTQMDGSIVPGAAAQNTARLIFIIPTIHPFPGITRHNRQSTRRGPANARKRFRPYAGRPGYGEWDA